MSDAIEISGRRATSFAINTSVASSTPKDGVGEYDVVSDVDCAIAIDRATPTPALTLATGYPLYANQVIPVKVGEGQSIYAIAGGAGNLKYHKTA